MADYSTSKNNRLRLMQNSPLWQGRGGFIKGIWQMGWVLFRFWLAIQLWGTAVRLAHFPAPTKNLSVAIAIATLLLIGWTTWGLWMALHTLGIRRLLLTLLIIYLLLFAVNILTLPDDRPIYSRFFSQAGQTAVSFGNTAVSVIKGIFAAPGEFRFAYTGERELPNLPPGFPTPDPQATPIIASSINNNSQRTLRPTPTATIESIEAEETIVPTSPQVEETAVSPIQNSNPESTSTPEISNSTPPTNLEIGGLAIVVNTNEQALLARAEPGTEHDIVTRFEEGSRLRILDGPQVVGEFTWWYVQGDSGEGWCADRWLQSIEN